MFEWGGDKYSMLLRGISESLKKILRHIRQYGRPHTLPGAGSSFLHKCTGVDYKGKSIVYQLSNEINV